MWVKCCSGKAIEFCIAVGLSSGIEGGGMWGSGTGGRENVCVFFTCVRRMKKTPSRCKSCVWLFPPHFPFPSRCQFFFSSVQQRCLEERHFNHVLLIGGMETKERVREARGGTVCIVCFSSLSHTCIRWVLSIPCRCGSPVFCSLLSRLHSCYSLTLALSCFKQDMSLLHSWSQMN